MNKIVSKQHNGILVNTSLFMTVEETWRKICTYFIFRHPQ